MFTEELKMVISLFSTENEKGSWCERKIVSDVRQGVTNDLGEVLKQLKQHNVRCDLFEILLLL